MKLYITGISGYLGSRLAARCRERGHIVTGSSRRELTLGQPCDSQRFSGIDRVVHCAHDFAAGAIDINVKGAGAVRDAARAAGVPRQIFVSSYSSRPDALSEYARTKFLIEQAFLAAGEAVVRPGLVLGYGGMFGRNMDFLLRTPVIPLLNGGKDLVPVIGIRRFLTEMESIVGSGQAGAYNLFERELVSMESLIRTLNRAAGHRALYIPVSMTPAILFLELAARIGLKLPVNLGNLKGLAANQAAIHSSEVSGGDLAASLREALEERRAASHRTPSSSP